jgi:hypothetical protein
MGTARRLSTCIIRATRLWFTAIPRRRSSAVMRQASVFLVNARPDELDDRDVMPRLASRTETVAEHEP